MTTIAQRLGTLRKNPSRAELQPFADEITRVSATKRLPATSAAAHLRHARSVLSDVAFDRLRELVLEAMSKAIPTRPATVMDSPYCLPAEAAAILGINTRTLLERLKHRDWRRLYGWACFDGHHWQLPRDALMPATRATFLAAQPPEEPAAHVAMLKTGIAHVNVDAPKHTTIAQRGVGADAPPTASVPTES